MRHDQSKRTASYRAHLRFLARPRVWTEEELLTHDVLVFGQCFQLDGVRVSPLDVRYDSDRVFVGFDRAKDGSECTVRAIKHPDGCIEVIDMVYAPRLLNWMEAVEHMERGVPLEYRDGGAMCRKGPDDWYDVDGPVTEHMSDFDFRVKAPTPPPPPALAPLDPVASRVAHRALFRLTHVRDSQETVAEPSAILPPLD